MAAETLINQISSSGDHKTLAAESDPDIVNSSPGDDVTAKEAGESKGDTCSTAVTNVQKKMRRAERFGMPVKLSEEEKRNTRAERFGTKPSSPGTDAVKSAEEQKRKARADRFGIPEQPVADNESKKKARIAKVTPASKNDPVEEDKRKARAARFSQVKVSSGSHINGEGNIEPKAAIVGKAGGGA